MNAIEASNLSFCFFKRTYFAVDIESRCQAFSLFYENPVKYLDSLYGLRQNPSNSLTREWIKAPVGFSLGQSKKQEVGKKLKKNEN